MDAIALAYSELPIALIEEHGLERLVFDRGGEKEIRFFRQVKNAILPIRHDGQLQIVSWGSLGTRLPNTGYTWLATVEAGEWAYAEEVQILATAGLRNGIWFPIQTGVRGVLAELGDERAAYMVVMPSTYYFKIMTRSKKEPVLIGETI